MAISTPRASRRDFIRLTSTMGVAAGLAATLAACAGSGGSSSSASATAEAPAAASPDLAKINKDGEIKAGISYELNNSGYDPMKATAALTVAANWHIFEGLTELDLITRKPYAALGADLPTMVDETTYEVALREGAMFSDGTPVTVDDVVFSFARVLDPANSSLYASFLPFLDSVSAKDDTTVTLTLKFPFSLVAERLSVVKIVPQATVEADPDSYTNAPVGTGPYLMTDNGSASQTVVFERNESYNGPRPALAKKMTWQILPDGTARSNALTSGVVHAIDTVAATDLTTYQAPVQVSADQGFGLVFAMFNNLTMTDLKARQAIMYALDYAKICETGMSGLATAATSFVQKEHPAYKEASTVYTYDVDKAKSLASEAGLTSIKLVATDHGFFSAARPIIRENLEAIGLTVEYNEPASSDAYKLIDGDTEGTQWDVLIAPGDPSVFGDDADLLMRWWYSGDTWTEQRMHWKGSEGYTKVQELLDAAAPLEGQEQLDKWHETFNALSEEIPLYPLFHRKNPMAWNSEALSGYQPVTFTGMSFINVGTTQA